MTSVFESNKPINAGAATAKTIDKAIKANPITTIVTGSDPCIIGSIFTVDPEFKILLFKIINKI